MKVPIAFFSGKIRTRFSFGILIEQGLFILSAYFKQFKYVIFRNSNYHF